MLNIDVEHIKRIYSIQTRWIFGIEWPKTTIRFLVGYGIWWKKLKCKKCHYCICEDSTQEELYKFCPKCGHKLTKEESKIQSYDEGIWMGS